MLKQNTDKKNHKRNKKVNAKKMLKRDSYHHHQNEKGATKYDQAYKKQNLVE